MNSDDRKYLAYLTAWAVGRITTDGNNAPMTPYGFGMIREVGEETYQNFYPVEDEPKEMTAKELVEKMEAFVGHTKFDSIGQFYLLDFAKKEAGL